MSAWFVVIIGFSTITEFHTTPLEEIHQTCSAGHPSGKVYDRLRR